MAPVVVTWLERASQPEALLVEHGKRRTRDCLASGIYLAVGEKKTKKNL